MFLCSSSYLCGEDVDVITNGVVSHQAKLISSKAVAGEGGFSVIHQGIVQEKKDYFGFKRTHVALKKKLLRDDDWEAGERELKLLLDFDSCPYILKVIAIQRYSSSLVIALELCCSLNISEISHKLPEETRHFCVLYFGAPILNALKYVQDKGYLHCDVKCGNVLLDRNGTPKLIDFGLTCEREKPAIATGTVAYMAPELIGDDEAPVTESSDSFSLGLTLGSILHDGGEAEWLDSSTDEKTIEKFKLYNSDPLSTASIELEKQYLTSFKVDDESMRGYVELKRNILESFVKNLICFNKDDRLTISEASDSEMVTETLEVFTNKFKNKANCSELYAQLQKVRTAIMIEVYKSRVEQTIGLCKCF